MKSLSDIVKEANDIAKFIRINSLEMVGNANSSHIGSCLSVADILAVLNCQLNQTDDELIFSKGHAAAALYASLAYRDTSVKESLKRFGLDGEELIGHANHAVKGIIFSTGSLGHGLPLAVGIALASKHKKVFVVISDGELNEGTTWESLAVANHLKLSNLTLIIDANGIQSFGSTIEVLNLEPLIDKIHSFGWNCIEIDGHSIKDLFEAIEFESINKPKAIIARTVKGKGILVMEGKLEWHYKSPPKEQIKLYIEELNTSA